MKEEFEAELDKIIKLTKDLKTICAQLQAYEECVIAHKEAIEDLQDFVVVDRMSIKELDAKVDKIEKKYGRDVMYG